jgi:hypothetical protein
MDSDERKAVEKILTDSASFYQRGLTEEAKAYLVQKRRISEDTIARFQIGFAGGGLKQHLCHDLVHPVELCINAGVLKKTDSGEVRDYFYNRIVFPNLKRGSVVNITGRRIDGADPKYLHLPGEMAHLYNEDALVNNVVLVAEGIPDCLTAVQAGFDAVAVLGTGNFKPGYVHKFSKCDKVFICMDGDAAGETAVHRIGELLPNKSYVVQLPRGTDLNEYMGNHTAEDLHRLVSSSKKFLSDLLEQIPADIDKTELSARLEVLIGVLQKMNVAEAEHFLEHGIRPRFELTGDETKAYRRLIGERRKEASAPRKQAGTQGEQVRYKAKFDGLVDVVWDSDKPAFLVKIGDTLSLQPHADVDGVRYLPPPKIQIPWLLPRSAQVTAAYEECLADPLAYGRRLFDALVLYFTEVSDLPDVLFYDLLASWCLHTYLLEGVQYTPIICFFAVPERGKSRTGKALIYVAYRGIHVESLREAYLYRVAENFDCSIFFDVKDIWRKAEKAGSEDILLQRFEKGAKVPRVLYPEKGPYEDTVYFSIFGPTLIATNESVDPILETRAVTINMPDTHRRFENDVLPEGALELKERLTAFRAWHLGRALPETQKPESGRLGDILKPLLQVIRLVRPDKEATFLELVARLKRERLFEKSSGLDAEILRTIGALNGQVWHGLLAVKAIAENMNRERPDRMKITPQRIGRRLKALGFDTGRTANGSSALQYDVSKIERMRAAYGLEETSETSETSDTAENESEPTLWQD